MDKINKVLVIAAHPDDEVLGCGGTLARLCRQGAEVHVLIVANGLTSRANFDAVRDSGTLELHHQRARRAGDILGVGTVSVLGMPDQRLDALPLLEITQALEREIARVQPDTIFTQHGGDLNLDHVLLYRATLTATRPLPGAVVRRVYAYEVASSTEWSFHRFEPRFFPSVFFDVSETLELKVAAMQVYESEVRLFPHPRSPEALRASAVRWGSVVGLHAAEAFELVREIHR
jgi:LmbE family N-acetylglucosaminyl deacetylase